MSCRLCRVWKDEKLTAKQKGGKLYIIGLIAVVAALICTTAVLLPGWIGNAGVVKYDLYVEIKETSYQLYVNGGEKIIILRI